MASAEQGIAALGHESSAAGADDEVAEALVAGARELMERVGIRRLRMDDVAKRAGYGRATLYRRFATRDELVWAVLAAEVRGTLEQIEIATAGIPTVRERLVEAFAATVEAVRHHPLLQRVLQIEPDLALPHLTTGGEPTLSMARRHVAGLLAKAQADGELGPIDKEVAADMIVRIAHSLLLTPGGPIAVDDPEGLRTFARDHLAGPIMHLATLGSRARRG